MQERIIHEILKQSSKAINKLPLIIQQKKQQLLKLKTIQKLKIKFNEIFSEQQKQLLFKLLQSQRNQLQDQKQLLQQMRSMLKYQNILRIQVVKNLQKIKQKSDLAFFKIIDIIKRKAQNCKINIQFPCLISQHKWLKAQLTNFLDICSCYVQIKKMQPTFNIRWIDKLLEPMQNQLKFLYVGQSRLHRLDMPQWMFEHMFKLILNNKKLLEQSIKEKEYNYKIQQCLLIIYNGMRPVILNRIVLNLSDCSQNPLIGIKILSQFSMFENNCRWIDKDMTLMQECLIQIQGFKQIIICNQQKVIKQRLGVQIQFKTRQNKELIERLQNMRLLIFKHINYYQPIKNLKLKQQFITPIISLLQQQVVILKLSFNNLFQNTLQFQNIMFLLQEYQIVVQIIITIQNQINQLTLNSNIKNLLDQWTSSKQIIQNKLASTFSHQFCRQFKKIIYQIGHLVFKTNTQKMQFQQAVSNLSQKQIQKSRKIKSLGIFLIPNLRQIVFDLIQRNIEINLIGLNSLFQQLQLTVADLCNPIPSSNPLIQAKKWILKEYSQVQTQKNKTDLKIRQLSNREANILMNFKGLISQ